MTARDLIQLADREPWLLLAIFALVPLAAFVVGRLHGPGNGAASPWRHVYAVLIYLACVPGMVATVLVFYTMFFLHQSLLDVSLTIYALPIAAMVLTLIVIQRQVAFDAIPGFDRLGGFLIAIAASFAIALAIDRARIWVFFGGSLAQLGVIATAVFLIARWGMRRALRGRR